MSKNMNKKIEDQDKLLDHIIEYGGKQYIDDEIEEFDQIPELELSDEFNQRMDKMFKNAYKKEVRKEHMHLARRVAAIAIVVLGIVSVTAMNVKAFREPVLNFIFKMNGSDKTKVQISNSHTSIDNFSFEYIPKGYTCTKRNKLDSNNQLVYRFENLNNNCIYFYMQLNQDFETYQNIDKASYVKVQKDNEEFYFSKGKNNKLLWFKNNIIYNISSSLSEHTMIKIAENIKSK